MNVLLDTHTLIWALEDNPTLSRRARNTIINVSNIVFVSAASVWEINIKISLGKLDIPDNLQQEIEAHRFTPLAINFDHAEAIAKLPYIHKDPFDRILIAQASIEKLTLITRDKIIPQYNISVIEA